MRQLMQELGPAKPMVSKQMVPGKVLAYQLPNNFFVAGRYPEGVGGGIDSALNSKGALDKCEELLLRLAQRGHVLFEGIMVSSVYGRWARMAQTYPFVWLFLDTPLDVCIERVQARSTRKAINLERVKKRHDENQRYLARAQTEKLSPLRMENMRHKYRHNERYFQRATQEGFTVRTIHWETALEDAIAAIKELT